MQVQPHCNYVPVRMDCRACSELVSLILLGRKVVSCPIEIDMNVVHGAQKLPREVYAGYEQRIRWPVGI